MYFVKKRRSLDESNRTVKAAPQRPIRRSLPHSQSSGAVSEHAKPCKNSSLTHSFCIWTPWKWSLFWGWIEFFTQLSILSLITCSYFGHLLWLCPIPVHLSGHHVQYSLSMTFSFPLSKHLNFCPNWHFSLPTSMLKHFSSRLSKLIACVIYREKALSSSIEFLEWKIFFDNDYRNKLQHSKQSWNSTNALDLWCRVADPQTSPCSLINWFIFSVETSATFDLKVNWLKCCEKSNLQLMLQAPHICLTIDKRVFLESL